MLWISSRQTQERALLAGQHEDQIVNERMSPDWLVDLRSAELFGNETAEDEDQQLFQSYAWFRPEFEGFLDPTKKVQIVRAYKGEGKSALLRLTHLRLHDSPTSISHNCYANSIAPRIADSDHGESMVRAWKEAFIRVAAGALGARLKFEFSDDAISLREEAERGGFRERGFLSAIMARFKSLPGGATAGGATDAQSALKRIAGDRDLQIWIIVDDVDENFTDTEFHCTKVMSAFVAMRQLSNEIVELRFRSSVRPGTWTIIKRKYEALSKVEPYVIDLQWTQEQLERMLGTRVQSYLRRNCGPAVASGQLGSLSARKLVAIALEDPMPWGQEQTRAPAVVIASLARYRPRWAIELCKLAADRAYKRRGSRIGFDDIEKNLEKFGHTRIDDLIAEFNAQCAKIELILTSFKGKPERFHTDELVKHVKTNLSGRDIRIAGIAGRPSEIEIIRFIFQIGFITARRDLPDGDYRHYSFFDEPSLLSDGALDLGVSWEIPSCFRQALQLKNVRRAMPR